jgi:hypothetical protein
VRVERQKMARTLIDLVRMRLGGSTATNQTQKQKGTDPATTRNHSPIERIKDLRGVSTLPRGLGGYTRRVCSRAPTGKNHDATTPVHRLTSLQESDHTLTQRLGGYCLYQQYGGTHIQR